MNPAIKLLSAFFVFMIKIVSRLLYYTEAKWLTPKEDIHWEELRLVVILNHTSLFEPLFISAVPNIRLWRAIERIVIPVADVTMNRPLVGKLYKYLFPNCIPITRKRDDTWERFINQIQGNSIAVIFPEGRMKRADGLDKHGKLMNIKGGVAEILSRLDNGKMLIGYSGGLHHVQSPGQRIPRIFKKIKISFEELDIAEYKGDKASGNPSGFRKEVVTDLQNRMDKHC